MRAASNQERLMMARVRYPRNIYFFSARVFPFKLSVVTDADEATVGAAAADSNTNEAIATINADTGSFGTAGFSLGFRQIPCA